MIVSGRVFAYFMLLVAVTGIVHEEPGDNPWYTIVLCVFAAIAMAVTDKLITKN